MKKISDLDIKEIIRLYTEENLTPKDIGIKFEMRNNSITRILRKNNVPRTQLIKVNDEDKEIIINKYLDGLSSELIANQLGINGTTVCRILKRSNIAIRPAEENKRKYKINQDYFSNIDTEDKAYFLGFLYADGNLSIKGNGIKLTLQTQDCDILEKFSNAIYGFNKISIETRTNSVGNIFKYMTVSVYSKQMHKNLQKWGCSPQKTFTICLPNNIDSSLMSHFIRGYFDGDGCLSLANKDRPRIDITSNINFISQLKSYLENELNIIIPKSGINGNTSNFQISAKADLKKFLDFIYKDATIYLERKRKYYEEYLVIEQNKKIFKMKDISKYGTHYIPDVNGNIITAEYVKTLDDAGKNLVADELVQFYRKNGFPYPTLTNDELLKEFAILKRLDMSNIENNIYNIYNMTGLSIIRHFSPHFFEVKCGLDTRRDSVLNTFNDDKKLKKVILNRLNLGYHINGNMLKQGLCNSHIAFKASVFNITVAKAIYEKFAKDDSIIYDYSCGFGNRLTAALSISKNIKYIGIDPYQKSIDSNQNIYNFLNESVPGLNKQIDLRCMGSEEFCDPQYFNKVDLAFSSPPYFYQEIYEDNVTQAYFDKNYQNFINKWWDKTVNNISLLLKEDGIFIINVKDIVDGFSLSEDMINVAKKYGFKLIDTHQLQLNKNINFKNQNNVNKFEPIFILQK